VVAAGVVDVRAAGGLVQTGTGNGLRHDAASCRVVIATLL
jgi:fructose-1,6-bisphosphatase/inositol monophosphatase family enzyme